MKKTKRPKQPVKRQNDWWCESCKDDKPMNHTEMLEHMATVHGLERGQMKGRRTMLSHLDAADWFSFQWQWQIPSPTGLVTLTQNTVNPREKNDPMRFEEG